MSCSKNKECQCKAEHCSCTGESKVKKGGCTCSGKGTECGCKDTGCTCKAKGKGCEDNCNGKKMTSADAGDEIRTITAQQLLKKIDTEPTLIVINVLPQEYYTKCHIRGSINVPLEQLQGVANESWDKHDKIVVYCANYECSASKSAFKLLHKLGFTQVCAYEGGIKEWCQKEYPIVGSCGD